MMLNRIDEISQYSSTTTSSAQVAATDDGGEDNNQKDRLNTTNNRRGTIGSLDVPAHTNTGYEIVPLLMKAT